MLKPQYAILRFAKYKGPEISRIEAHDERKKDSYASNPDVDMSRSHLNYHLIEPNRKYRAEAERQIAAAGCRTRSDSVHMVEGLVTASPEFFRGKKPEEVKAFFACALEFMQTHQRAETFISAVVHMDEKTPHMHFSFVPITEDGRLSAKDIIGNRKRLVQWQDEFWRHMVKKYPELERGESASETGREHIPPRVFKQMAHLNRQRDALAELIDGITPFNIKTQTEKICTMLDKYLPGVENMATLLKKYKKGLAAVTEENEQLAKEKAELSDSSILKKMQEAKLLRDYESAVAVLNSIPQEVVEQYAATPRQCDAKER